jgi:hypothetical protein
MIEPMLRDAKERDNLLRWDGRRRGWYEVYYLKWNDPKTETAAWVRYTMTSPLPGRGKPYCELWGIFFDAARPERCLALKDRFPISLFSWDSDRFLVGVAEAELAQNSCHGALADEAAGHRLSWDLKFDSATPSFHHFPHEKMYALAFPQTKVLSPHEFCRFSGELVADGRKITLAAAPGQQTHIWGAKHAHRWAWGHCNSFAEEPDAIWEALDTQIKLGPLVSPHLKMIYLKYQGKDYRFNGLGKLLTNRSRWDLGRWTFAASGPDLALRGEVSCRPEQMVGVTYTDPDGDHLWCHNSKIAAIKLDLLGPGRKPITTLTSAHACAAEFVDRKTYPEVPIRI